MWIFIICDGRYWQMTMSIRDTLNDLRARIESCTGVPAANQLLRTMDSFLVSDEDLRAFAGGKAGERRTITVIRTNNSNALINATSQTKELKPRTDDSPENEEDTICTAVLVPGEIVQPMFIIDGVRVCSACAKRCCTNVRHQKQILISLRPSICNCRSLGPDHCVLSVPPSVALSEERINTIRQRLENKTKELNEKLMRQVVTQTLNHPSLSAASPQPPQPQPGQPGQPVPNPQQRPLRPDEINAGFLNQLRTYSKLTECVANAEIQERALMSIIIDDVDALADDIARTQGIDRRDAFMCALCRWFKSSFFTFVDGSHCPQCGSEAVNRGRVEALPEERRWGAERVELYHCTSCQADVRFPRYNHPVKLLETRRGRCGEAAILFYVLARSLGIDARLVLDVTDHVWNELYSETQERWIHCDPSEGTWNKPLTYERGWGKRLSYCIAFSLEEVLDVTRRYTEHFHDAVLPRRTLANEEGLKKLLDTFTMSKLKTVPAHRRDEILRRRVKDITELGKYEKSTAERAGDYSGRVSGSAQWREARGEAGPAAHTRGMSLDAWLYSLPQDRKLLRPITNMRFTLNGCATFAPNRDGSDGNGCNNGGRMCSFVLTPDRPGMRGSVWTQVQPDLFQTNITLTQFAIVLSGRSHADGLAFVIQSEGNCALGDGGSDLGFGGITHSVAVEFDTYDSYTTHDDPNDNHVSIHTRGAEANTAHHSASRACSTAIPKLSDGRLHIVTIATVPVHGVADSDCAFRVNVWIDSAPALTDVVVPGRGICTESALWVGLTAATGGLSQEHRVMDFTIHTLNL